MPPVLPGEVGMLIPWPFNRKLCDQRFRRVLSAGVSWSAVQDSIR